MRLMYIVLSRKDEETEKKLTPKQFDYIWDDDSRHYKRERAVEQARKWTRQFNKQFGTNYEWEDLYGIDEEYFDSEGYRW